MKNALALALAALVASGIAAHAAPTTFFGEDLNNSAFTPLAATPNADSAEASFLSFLSGTSTEDFESISSCMSTPIHLSFSGSAGTLSAILSGSSGTVVSVAPESTNGAGRYATSGRNFFEVAAGGANDFTSSHRPSARPSRPLVSAGSISGISVGACRLN
jgi:hypothetical protein